MSTGPNFSSPLHQIAEETPEVEMRDPVDCFVERAHDVDEGVKAAANQCMKLDLDSLYPILTSSPEVFQALNAMLHKHHGVTVAGFDTDDNGGKYILFNQDNERWSVRQCKLNMQMYSLRQTLEWVLNKREGSIQWALEFGVRDFQ